MIQDVLLAILGLLVFAAGLWWLGGGRWGWMPTSRFHREVSLPTRMVVALVHLVLGYHLVVWSIPSERKPLQMPRGQWPWLVLGCAAAVGGSRVLDRLEQSGGRQDGDAGE